MDVMNPHREVKVLRKRIRRLNEGIQNLKEECEKLQLINEEYRNKVKRMSIQIQRALNQNGVNSIFKSFGE